MSAFNYIETVQVIATGDSQVIEFKNRASVESQQILIDNEGINTVYITFLDKAETPSDEPIRGAIPVLPMSSKKMTKQHPKFVSYCTTTGISKINISTGQS